MTQLNNLRKWIGLLTFTCCIGFTTTTQARTTELIDPAPVPIPQGLTPEQVQNAVKGALIQKRWLLLSVSSESPRIEEVEYRVRAHVMSLRLEYLPDSIKFTYAGSEQLNFKAKKNKQFIHPNYLVWSQQLADQIKSNLAQGADFKVGTLATLKTGNTPPKLPFSAFGHFNFEPTTLAEALAKNPTSVKTGTNLDHNIAVAANPKLSSWNKPGEVRTLKIKSHISGLRFIGGGARYFAGRMAGRSWIKIDLSFEDAATGELIGNASLYRIAEAANGFTLARNDYAMVEEMGRDIVKYIDTNYEKPIGGGTTPP